MPYYLCKSENALTVCTSWSQAKACVHGKKGSWAKRYETKGDVQEAYSRASRSFEDVSTSRTQVFVDGSAILNEWSACAVFFSDSDARNEVKLLPPPHTSPRAELAALLLALEKGAVSCDVMSDSSFVCHAFERGWPEDFAHQDLIVQIRAMWPSRDLRVLKVAGHAGVLGNEIVDGMLRVVREARQREGRVDRLQVSSETIHGGGW
jgi:ribonuclease HI